MLKEEIISAVEPLARDVLGDEPAHFLVDVRIKPTHNIKVFVDGDAGIGLAELVLYNRRLYKLIEDSGLFPEGDFSLEVSSPGLDEPLKLHRQYQKNEGRYVELQLIPDARKLEGKLLAATEDGIVVETEEGKGKKKVTKQETILFTDIKEAKIQIRF